MDEYPDVRVAFPGPLDLPEASAMFKNVLIALLTLASVTAIGLFFWARSVLAHDGVRTALAAQLSRAIGHPVGIASIDATIFPRVTVRLHGVSMGDPTRVQVRVLNIGTNLRALLGRRIEHATVELEGARIELPLPAAAISRVPAEADGQTTSSAAPVEIVSIDDIVLRDMEIVSGGRTLRGDVDLAWEGGSVTLRSMTLSAEGMAIDATGLITDLSGPVGELAVKAGTIDFNQLMAFATDFSSAAGLSAANPQAGDRAGAARPADRRAMNLSIAVDADRATLGGLAIERLSGRARMNDQGITLEPIAFGVLGGRYEGVLALAVGGTPGFDLKAAVSGVDMAAATAFAGSPGAMTGRLSGRIALAGRGLASGQVIDSARGTFRVDVADGVVKGLGLIRAVVVATSMRANADIGGAAAGSRDEPFSRLGATLAIAGGTASTDDLRFESEHLSMTAQGSLALDGSAVNLRGQVQLSERLTEEAGTDLKRYAQQDGRVTLPVTVGGSVDNLAVRIDAGAAAQRAIRNRVTEEAQKAIGRGLGGLLR
jgi:uncharacterized protein involved in outer membrane biogenesis